VNLTYSVIQNGPSRSFPEPHQITQRASAGGTVVLVLGRDAGRAFASLPQPEQYLAILIELGTECLGVHTGEDQANEGSNVLGFARFRLGDAPPTNLVELVKQSHTHPESLSAARSVFEDAGLVVATCNDFPGRVVDSLIRPYFNAALRRLDEGLASAADLDTTLRLGLGYPEGPIELLHRTGLVSHFDVSQALYEALADPAFAPARRARVAKARAQST
jgi:3-hydroxybutyryl-CoA dehydrogenase